MNKRGMTLSEIIISVTLISIVLIFMIKLLTTLRYEQNFTNYEKNNSIARAEIIKTVQTDLMNLKLFDLKDESNTVSGDNQAIIHFVFADIDNTNKYLIVEKDSISYCKTKSCTDDTDRTWKLNKSRDDVFYDPNCILYDYDIDTSSEYFWIKFVIKLDNNSLIDNTIDDIEIFYLGEKGEDYNNSHIPQPADLYLGKHANNACNE